MLFTLDVFDAATGRVIASRDVRRADLSGSNVDTSLKLNFSATAGMNLEFRMKWNGQTKSSIDKVNVA